MWTNDPNPDPDPQNTGSDRIRVFTTTLHRKLPENQRGPGVKEMLTNKLITKVIKCFMLLTPRTFVFTFIYTIDYVFSF